MVASVLVPSLKARVPALVRLMMPALSEKVKLVPTVKPPEKVLAVEVVAPRPVTVARVSASELRPLVADEVMVIVEPEVETEALPEPLMVRAPEALLTVLTREEERLIVGFWVPVTLRPVPAVRP